MRPSPTETNLIASFPDKVELALAAGPDWKPLERELDDLFTSREGEPYEELDPFGNVVRRVGFEDPGA